MLSAERSLPRRTQSAATGTHQKCALCVRSVAARQGVNVGGAEKGRQSYRPFQNNNMYLKAIPETSMVITATLITRIYTLILILSNLVI